MDIEAKPRKLIIDVKGPRLEIFYGSAEKADVEMQLTRDTMEEIVNGRMAFQRAFMSGARTKGDFTAMRMLDQIFPFSEVK